MKRFRVWGLSAALAGFAGSAAAAPPTPQVEQTTLMRKLFSPRAPKPAGPTVDDPLRTTTITAPLSPEVIADAVRAEQDAYLRRVSVCTELRRVALERGDDALIRQADELERQAGALYNARVASLGIPRAKTPLPETRGTDTATRGASSESITTRAKRLESPSTPVPGSTTAQVREVKP